MIVDLAYFLLLLSIPLLLYRIAKGPTWADRIITADLLAVYLVAGLLILETQLHWRWDRDVIWLVLCLSLATMMGASLLVKGRRRAR